MEKALYNIDDIPEGGCSTIEFNHSELFIVKKNRDLFVYLNRCPHMYVPLNWEPNKFLNNSADLIQCSNHGALFDIETGECLQGPCQGQHLQAIEYEVKEGNIYIKESDLNKQ